MTGHATAVPFQPLYPIASSHCWLQVSTTAGASIAVDETNISWKQDREHKYAAIPAANFNTDPALRGGAPIPGDLDQDEHFIVWMRPATMPNFRKLWGRINQDLPRGTVLNLTISNRQVTHTSPTDSPGRKIPLNEDQLGRRKLDDCPPILSW